MTMRITDNAALVAEVARLQAIVDRVEALASGARLHWNSAPANGTLAVVDKSGGWQDREPWTRVYVRSDEPDTNPNRDPYFPGGGDWFQQSPDTDNKPWMWGEVNSLDDPECDRPSVSIETYVSVDDLDAALGGAA